MPSNLTGGRVDFAYTNDQKTSLEDRNVYIKEIGWAPTGQTTILKSASQAIYDRGSGTAAFDGINTSPGQELMSTNGALRFTIDANQT